MFIFFGVLARPSGTSIDWAYGTQNIPFSYLFEFRDKGTTTIEFIRIANFLSHISHRFCILTTILGHHGFLLPTDQIIPNSLEIIDGLVAMIKEAEKWKFVDNCELKQNHTTKFLKDLYDLRPIILILHFLLAFLTINKTTKNGFYAFFKVLESIFMSCKSVITAFASFEMSHKIHQSHWKILTLLRLLRHTTQWQLLEKEINKEYQLSLRLL